MNPQPEEGKASVKKLSDYLHLYLGCGMYNKGLADHLYAKGIPYTPQKLRTVGSDGLFWVGSEEDSREVSTTQFKLILRPLSDMTEGEFRTWANYGEDKLNGPNLKSMNAEEIRYLLSKHFDLFGLIESGLAIDKTKLNSHV